MEGVSVTEPIAWSEKSSEKKARFFENLKQLDQSTICEVKFPWSIMPQTHERSEREAAIADALVENCRELRRNHELKIRGDPSIKPERKAEADADWMLGDERCARSPAIAFDFFLPRLGVLLEFDEKQHFTLERRLTFDFYKFGEFVFTDRWKSLCETFKQNDRHPPDRDWERAFKDAVRDLRSREHMIPLVRVFVGDFDERHFETRDILARLEAEIEQAKALI